MTFEKIKEMIIEKFNVDGDKVSMETSFIDDLGADSLDAVELVMTVENEFNISISDEEAQSIQTVGDIVKIIESKN